MARNPGPIADEEASLGGPRRPGGDCAVEEDGTEHGRAEATEATDATDATQTRPTTQPPPSHPRPAPLDAAAAAAAAARPRTSTSTAEIGHTIARPGPVKINVQGAFIVEEEPAGAGGASPTAASSASSSSLSPAGASAETATATVEGRRAGSGSGSGSGSGGSGTGHRSHSPLSEHHTPFDIRLPNHHAVVSHIAVDIGGTLAKVVYFTREAQSTDPGGRLNFISFETDRIDECIDFLLDLKRRHMEAHDMRPSELCIMATGGGAYKYYDRIRARMGNDVLSEDEMECLIMGLDFFITEIPREVFTYSETDPMHFAAPSDDIYPYMLVNIGSGVSMLKVSGPHDYVRVGGTSLGGGTLWGLLSLLTGARTFDEMLELASRGDNARVDMLVGDIYGTDYTKIGLKSTAIASSFGKVFRMKHLAESEAEDGVAGGAPETAPETAPGQHPHTPPSAYNTHFSAADISRSLLYAISNNIGQIAYLQSQIHNLSSIYFGGSFIQGHPQTMNTLSYAIKFWSKGTKQAYFLRHEGYLGAVGAFLKRQPRNWGRRSSVEGLEQRVAERLAEDAKEVKEAKEAKEAKQQ